MPGCMETHLLFQNVGTQKHSVVHSSAYFLPHKKQWYIVLLRNVKY
jgi:hypothetical protein